MAVIGVVNINLSTATIETSIQATPTRATLRHGILFCLVSSVPVVLSEAVTPGTFAVEIALNASLMQNLWQKKPSSFDGLDHQEFSTYPFAENAGE